MKIYGFLSMKIWHFEHDKMLLGMVGLLGVQQEMIMLQASASIPTGVDVEQSFCLLPSGKLTVCYGKIHHFSWVNPLFLWPFSIAMLVYQRVIIMTRMTFLHYYCYSCSYSDCVMYLYIIIWSLIMTIRVMINQSDIVVSISIYIYIHIST